MQIQEYYISFGKPFMYSLFEVYPFMPFHLNSTHFIVIFVLRCLPEYSGDPKCCMDRNRRKTTAIICQEKGGALVLTRRSYILVCLRQIKCSSSFLRGGFSLNILSSLQTTGSLCWLSLPSSPSLSWPKIRLEQPGAS